jgi:DnaA family protein
MEFGPAILDDLESIDWIAIDDIQLAAGDARWEHALFKLFNRLQDIGGRLLISVASGGAQDVPFGLADLSSRLRSGLICQLFDLNDNEKQAALQRRAIKHGLSMSDNVARYLINRLRRDMHELTTIFERIDAASLSAGRELTIPFVRDVLGLD